MNEASLHENVPMESLVARVADEFLERQTSGQRPDVEEYAGRYPEAAALLRKVLASLELIGLSRGGSDLPATVAEPAGVLGDFRIVREVGKGGMGIVYEAEQLSLRRRVALKVLPFAATMDPRHLQRFHNEAQAAACLHHTNIVPVFSVGCERGVHFYAMQFIDGQPLSEAIQQLRDLEKKAPTPQPTAEVTPLSSSGRRGRDYFRKVAELGVQAAEALDYAHQLGIVHRDIKPGNLLVDDAGRLWVTDFGLAHVQHGETGLTLTGQTVGTPRYMSPEQALARRVPLDHRTDVYSLGATLYELLTLRPAFGSDNRQELLRQIVVEDPIGPRRLERAIPAELEVIVQKAMEKRPQDRYATARELADDLRRWLLDQPIRARRPRLLARAGKWVRRHKTAAAAGAAVLLMALVLAGYVGWTRHEQALRRAASEQAVVAALADSQDWQEQRRLPEALSAARRADGMLAGAEVGESLRRQVRARLSDLELLERLENIRLEKMTAVKDGRLDDEGADAMYRQTFRDAGLDVEALSAAEAAERIRNTTVAVELAAALDHWAELRRTIRGMDDPSWRSLLRVAREADPDAWRTRLRQALERRDWPTLREAAAAAAEVLADPDAWRTRLRQALERGDFPAVQETLGSAEVLHLPPATLSVLGGALRADPESRAQTETFLRAAQRRYPNDFWLNANLGAFFSALQPPRWEEAYHFDTVAAALRPRSPVAHFSLGRVLLGKGDRDGAIAEFREAIRLQEDYVLAYRNLSRILAEKGQLAEAIAAHRKASHFNSGLHRKDSSAQSIAASHKAIAAYREAVRLKKEFSHVPTNLGAALRDNSKLDEAIAQCRESVRLHEDDASAHYNLGIALLAKGRSDEAIATFRAALRINNDDADAHDNLGHALQMEDRQEEAIAEYREAIRLKKDSPATHAYLGDALMKRGRRDEAIVACREAVHLNKDFAEGHHALGKVLMHTMGRPDEAIAEFREAIRIDKDYVEAHCDLALMLRGKGQFTEALVHIRRGHELGSQDPRWPYPSAGWIPQFERLVEEDGKLLAILKGQKQPADPEECLQLVSLCQQFKHWHAAAVRLYRAAFAAKPQLAEDPIGQHRYNAARCAALAGCGQGEDAAQLNTPERVLLRRQALDWLRDDLEVYRQLLDKSPDKTASEIANRLRGWLRDGKFAGVRGPDSLAQLPAAERPPWQKLWQEVEALRKRAATMAAVHPNRP